MSKNLTKIQTYYMKKYLYRGKTTKESRAIFLKLIEKGRIQSLNLGSIKRKEREEFKTARIFQLVSKTN